MEVIDIDKAGVAHTGTDESQTTPVQVEEKESPLYWQLGQKLGACMRHLYTTKMWTDVTFRCKDHVEDDKSDRIHAHKIVLAARSPFFQSMLFGPFEEKKSGDIDLLTTEAEIFDLVIRYIYSDETNLTEDTAVRVLKLAHMYQIPTLVEYCADFLASVLREDNACNILELALLYKQTKLKCAVCVFIDNHAKQVLDSDGFLLISNDCLTFILKGDTLFENEEYIFKRAMDWAESKLSCNGETVDGQSKRDALGEAFFYLRVPTLGNLEFVRCTKGHGYYTVKEMEDIIEYINDKGVNASLCHSVAVRAPCKLEVHVSCVGNKESKPTDPIFYKDRQIKTVNVKTLNCTVLVKVSKDCFIHGISLLNMFPSFAYQSYQGKETKYAKDSLADVTLDCILSIDEIQFKTKFEMKQNKLQHVILENPVPLRTKDTPYSLKFEMKYRSEHSYIYLGALIDSSSRAKCNGTNHTETCLYMLKESECDASYCNSSEHFDCIKSLDVHYRPCRSNDNSDSKEIPGLGVGGQ